MGKAVLRDEDFAGDFSLGRHESRPGLARYVNCIRFGSEPGTHSLKQY